MKIRLLSLILLTIVLLSAQLLSVTTIYNISLKDIDGRNIDLSAYKGKVIVITNIASQSPLTDQMSSLQQLHEQYKDKDVIVIGCPSNSYGNELDTDKDIRSFCRSKYKITFPLSTKIEVKGSKQHPLFEYLSKKELNGNMSSMPHMDFQKFIIDKNGYLTHTIEPNQDVLNKEVLSKIEALLD